MGDRGSQGRLAALATALRAHVEYQAELGELGVLRPAPPAPTPGACAGAAPRDLFAEPAVAQAATLEALRAAIGDCRRCKLAPHRTRLVFGVGNPGARLAFVGEGPGYDEDLQGEPFVGRAGQLLTEIITRGMRLRREDVYICNVVKCRPPGNRNPEPDEVAACEPFLRRQIELIGPEVIVALGKFAAQTLLETKTPITKLRGCWADYHGIRLMPTFHPAYLLRNPGDKRLVWEDIQKVMRVLGLEPGRR
ncbi:MAG TPA: uracil-DNA glycosylase [Candidatus Binatia bacterium]|nr:uracil-DNA glycosylase [Candidatus Binatia bacterium]